MKNKTKKSKQLFLDKFKTDFCIEIKKIKEISLKDNIPIIEDDIAEFLSFYLKNKYFENILEIGTGYGYSISIIEKYVKYENIVSLEKDINRYNIAKKNLRNVNVLNLNALDYLDDRKEKINLFILDGAKSHYLEILKKAEKLFANDIYIIADNVFSRGLTYEEVKKRNRTIKRNMNEFLEYIKNNYDMTIIDIGDGLLIARKSG